MNDDFQEIFNVIIELQDMLYEISDSAFETIIQFINSHNDIFLKDKDSLRRLLLVINSSMNCDPRQLSHYQHLFDFLKEKLRTCFSSNELFFLFKENKAALLFLMNNNLINSDSIFAFKRHFEELLFYFAPEILERYQHKKRRFYHKQFEQYLFHEMNPKEHIEIRSKLINPDKMLATIRDNDLISFQDITSRSEINFSLFKIKHTFFEPASFINEMMIIKLLSLTEYASFFGAVDIIKFLFVNGADLTKYRCKFAIAGGNSEIIHLFEEKEANFKNLESLASAIQFHHAHIIEYLHVTQNIQYEIDLIQTCVKFNKISMLTEILNEIEKSDKDKEIFLNSIKIATRDGNFDLFLFLFDQIKKREIQTEELFWVKLLNKACKYGYLNFIQYFIDKLHVSYTNNIFNGLYKASKSGNLPAVQYLCNLPGINLNYTDSVSHDTPFTIAAYRGYFDVVKFLFSVNGVDINHFIYNNQTAIFRAAEGQNYEILKFLHENTPNTNNFIIDMNGFDLLSLASQFDCPEIVKYLIEKVGFDVNSNGLKPIKFAIQNSCVNVLKYFLTLDNCKLVDDESGQTFLYYAVYYRIEEAVKLFIESKRIDINAKDKDGV